jgi:hypothetical protein
MVHQGATERHRRSVAGLTSLGGGNVIGRLAQRPHSIMAIGTAGRDSCVVVTTAREGPTRPRTMTTVAGQSSRDVIGRFPGRLHSIVTGGASTGSDSGMVERYGRPRRRTMACIARQRGWKMGRRFPLLDGIIVASCAGSRRHSVVGKKCRRPVGRAMATAAIQRRRKMIGGLERRHYPSSGRMAPNALRRRSTKHPLGVAPFTHDLGMAAGQLESC